MPQTVRTGLTVVTEPTPDFEVQTFTHEVAGEGDFKFGTDREALLTRTLAPCIALAGINKATGYKLLGHYSGLSTSQRDKFSDAVDSLDVLGEPEGTRIYLLGGANVPEHDIDTTSDREHATGLIWSHLAQRGVPLGLLKTRWTEPGKCIDVAIKVLGGVVLHEYPRA